MAKGVRIALDAAKRMANATVAVERDKRDLSGGGLHGSYQNPGFWAKITVASSQQNSSAGVNDYKYSWEKVEFLATGLWASRSEWGTGDRTKNFGYAVELTYRSAYVPVGSIVWMFPAMTQEFYLFYYASESRWAKLSSDITAMSGSTYGKGTVRLEKQSVDNTEVDNYHTGNMLAYWAGDEELEMPEDEGEASRVKIEMIMGRWHIQWAKCEV